MKPLMPLSILLIGLLGSCALPEQYQDPKIWDRPRAEYRIILSTVLPPQVGKNLFQVRLIDPQGIPITDAMVTFYFRMAPMSFMMPQVGRGKMIQPGLYQTQADLKMGGDWDISVEIERPGFPKILEKFVVNAGPM
jgi:YtkA-like